MLHLNWLTSANRIGAAFAAASLTFSAVTLGILPATAQSEKSPLAAIPDGTYLYGESSKPNEIGKGYFVFESKQGQVVGALYMPFSSFDCAAGAFKGERLALNVTNSYDRSTNPFEIALEKTSTTVASTNPAAAGIGLQGFHKLDKVSDEDQRFLNTCKADLQGQAKK